MTASERHISVLGREAVEMLAPRAGGVYVDATFGAGGYSRAILDIAGTRVIGIDRDRSAIAAGFDLVDRSDGRLMLVEDRFSNLAEVCAAQGHDAVDGVVMDIGVSSMQLDQAARGFSFRLDGPLDMRMGHDGPSAADVVAKAPRRSRAHHLRLRRRAKFPRRRARHRRGAQGSADRDDAGAGRYRRRVVRPSRAKSIPRRARSRRCESSSTRSSTNCSWRWRRRSGAEARRAAGRGLVPFAGRPHRQDVLRPSAARSAADRGICRKSRTPRRACRC